MKKKFKLMDLDCANCAAKMEDAVPRKKPAQKTTQHQPPKPKKKPKSKER